MEQNVRRFRRGVSRSVRRCFVEFVDIAEPVVEDLELVYDQMRSRDLSGAPPKAEDAFDEVIVSYANKLSAITGILTSARIGDPDGEQRALGMLQSASADGIAAACSFVAAVGGDAEQVVPDAAC